MDTISIALAQHPGAAHTPARWAGSAQPLRRSEQLRAVIAMASALTATLAVSELLDRALHWMLTLSGHDQGSIMLTERGGKALLIRAVAGHEPSLVGMVAHASEDSVAGWVLKHRQHLYLEGRGASFPGKQRTYTKDVASSIVLPLLTTKGLPVGVLSLNSTHSTTKLSEDDIQVLQAMANLVAIAIDDAEVYQALHQKDQQLKAAATDLVKAQEEERKHVAYDLHDGLAQMIAGTYQRLQGLRANTALTPGQAERELDRVQAQLKQSLEEVRRVIADLRPSVLDDFGLETALRQYLAVRQAEADWELDCDISLKEPKLEPYIENTVFRIVQEAATNVLKHAESGRLLVRVTQGREWLDVEVRDWGKGFRPLVTKKPAPGRQVGLEAMADRAALLGGTFKVVSRPGQGTRITVRLPLPGSASEA